MSSIVGRTYEFFDNHVYTRRHDLSLPLTVSILYLKTPTVSVPCSPAMPGYLRDISRTGVSIVVPTIRFGNCSLVSGNYPLGITIELPNGAINIQVAPVRYDRLGGELGRSRYLIGARIMQISDSDRQHLTRHLEQFRKRKSKSFSFAREANSK
jgi:hypothetical protein